MSFYEMKPFRIIWLCVISLLLCPAVWSATRTASQSGNWNSTSTWGGNPVPVAGDAEVINTYSVTVDINTAACASVSLGTGTAAYLVFNAGSKLTVTGDITLGGTGTKKANFDFTNGGHLVTGTFSNWNGSMTYGTGTVEVTGNIAAFGSADFTNWYNLTFSGTSNCTLNSTAYIYGTLTLSAGTSLTSGGNYLRIHGDWTINATATFNCGSTTNDYVAFEGSATNNITGNVTLNRVWANKSSNNKVIASGDVTINNRIFWTRGIFGTSGSGKYILVDGYLDQGGGDAQNCHSGWVRKVGDDAYTFLLCDGDGTNYSPLVISDPGTDVTASFTASYTNTDPTNAGYNSTLTGAGIDHASKSEYWILDRTAGTGSVTVTLAWNSAWSGSITDLANLRVVRWNGSAWTNEGPSGGGSGTPASGTITSTVVGTYSPFTIGSATGGGANPLPVELLSFTGDRSEAGNHLKWITAKEINSSHYEIERSSDGYTFFSIGSEPGAGNSSTSITYQWVDQDPPSGIQYYRLRQVDINGKFSYSNVVAVSDQPMPHLSVNPTLSSGELQIKLFGEKDEVFRIILRDILGREFYLDDVFLERSEAIRFFSLRGRVTSGMYVVIAQGRDQVLEQRIVVR